MAHSHVLARPMGLAHRRRFSPLTLVARARAARRERRALAKLDDHLLDDIGLTRRAAWSEAKRPFWELPSRHHW